MANITNIAQALLQGQSAQVAPTTGVLSPQQQQAQALLAQQQQAQQIPQAPQVAPARDVSTPQGLTLASELLKTSQDRLGNPIIRGIAAFLGTKELIKEREAAGAEKMRAERRLELKSPLSPAGKIQADITAGLISPEIGAQLLTKAAAPRAPLVSVSTGDKVVAEGQKVLSKSAAGRISIAQQLGSLSSDIQFKANRVAQAAQRGSTGTFANIKTFATEVAQSFGVTLSPAQLQAATDVRKVNKIFGQGALENLANLKGSTSNRDLAFARDITGRVTEGEGAILETVDLMNAGAIKAERIAKIADDGVISGMRPVELDVILSRAKRDIKLEDIFNEVKAERLQREEQARLAAERGGQTDPRTQSLLQQGISLEEIEDFKRRKGIQ